MDKVTAEFFTFVDQLRLDGVLTTCRGCSVEEVARLEREHGCTVPRMYRLYLETLGHDAGRLFTHDHLAVTYDFVLELREQLEEAMAEPHEPTAPVFRLPQNSFLIAAGASHTLHSRPNPDT